MDIVPGKGPRKVLTFRNDFHGTSSWAQARYTNRDGEYLLDYRQVKRLRKKLCGIVGCACGGNLSERGPQPGHPIITPQPGGEVTVDYGV